MKRSLRYLILGIWLVASTKFTYDVNQDDPALVIGWGTAILSSVLAFNLPIWLILSARDRRRLRKKIANGELSELDDQKIKNKRIRKAVVWALVFALGYQVVQETNAQTALLAEAPQVSAGKSAPQGGNEGKSVASDKTKNQSKAKTPTPIEQVVPGKEDANLAWIEVGAKSGYPVVWKTCNDIQVFVNTGGSPNAVDDVKFVIDYLNSLGTLNFQYAGTNEKELIGSGFKSNYQVQITYGARESFINIWRKKEAIAVGGSVHFDNTYSSGQIAAYLPSMDDANQDLRRSVILHEFGHVLGLAHTTTPGDVMYPSVTNDITTKFNQEIVDYFANNPGCVK